MNSIQTIFSVLGVLCTTVQALPYVLAVWQGKAKPNIVSWSTWTLLTAIGAAAAFANGNWRVGLVIAANCLATTSIVVVGLRRGYAKMGWLDGACQVLALAGLVSWPLLHSAAIAVVMTVIVDAIALIPTLHHAWRSPREEVWLSYAVAGLGSVFALLAVAEPNIEGLAYPIYLIIADVSVVAIILGRRHLD